MLGTDELGHDLLVRIMYGAQISLFVGMVTTLIATVAGVSMGLITGYFGGWVDAVLARVIDSVLAFPYIVLALSLAVVFGPSLPIVIGVISFFSWAGIARIVRGQTLSLKEKEYIEAARSLGSGPWRIMFIDILPNLMAPVLVLATLTSRPRSSSRPRWTSWAWACSRPRRAGATSWPSAQSYYQDAWWYLVFPALALVITTVAFNLLGDGIATRWTRAPSASSPRAGPRKRAPAAGPPAGPAASTPTRRDSRRLAGEDLITHGTRALPDPPDPVRHRGPVAGRHAGVLPVLRQEPGHRGPPAWPAGPPPRPSWPRSPATSA